MISENPKVSIFVITYNQEEFVREGILSCINQDYNNFEVVISDDGSSDKTAEILLDLKNIYPDKIKLILNSQNRGITINSNIALSNCDGELIAFMGGDDVFYRNKISTQVMEFRNDPKLVFCYHPCHVLIDGKVVDSIGGRKKDLVKDFYDILGKYGANIPGPVPMVLRKAVPSTGFNEKLLVASDWMFYIDVCAKGNVKRISEILSAYRKHRNNVGHKIHLYSSDFLNTIDFVKEKYPCLKASKMANKAAIRFLLGVIYRCIAEKEYKYLEIYLKEYKRRNGKMLWLIMFISRINIASKIFRIVRKSLKKIF